MFIKMLLSLKMYEKKENLKALSESMVDAIAKEDEQLDVKVISELIKTYFFLFSFFSLHYLIFILV